MYLHIYTYVYTIMLNVCIQVYVYDTICDNILCFIRSVENNEDGCSGQMMRMFVRNINQAVVLKRAQSNPSDVLIWFISCAVTYVTLTCNSDCP